MNYCVVSGANIVLFCIKGCSMVDINMLVTPIPGQVTKPRTLRTHLYNTFPKFLRISHMQTKYFDCIDTYLPP